MRNNDGRKIDHHTLEVLRLRAIDQVAEGQHPEEIAAALGLHRKTVYKWLAKYREGGREAVLSRPVPGRPSKLSDEQLAQVYEWVAGCDPSQLRFDYALWTRKIVQQLIAERFGVQMSVSAVSRMLHRLGLSPQRPLWRAWQADEEKVKAFKEQQYPQIAKNAKKQGATVYFADEAGLRSDHHAGRTWAAKGQTPVVKTTGARFSLNMISAVTAKGLLRFSTFTGSMTAPKFIDFVKRLMRDTQGPVYLIVDGHPVHRSKEVRQFAENSEGMLKLFFLPGYSPQLNPDEWVWKNIKNDQVGRAVITGPDQMKRLAVSGLRRLQRLPHLVRGFFHDPNLAYIHTAA
ncbi:IS630 family transposase [Nesterenkonia ebinurensis]|uniref:IS630 family transposase n=1 Tax=Nesterenkonia ebinurensis TaxID=2608252 RepID=UPI00123DAA82|nr:IS630 family transposase [Nesterenkonia ebinurensis]